MKVFFRSFVIDCLLKIFIALSIIIGAALSNHWYCIFFYILGYLGIDYHAYLKNKYKDEDIN